MRVPLEGVSGRCVDVEVVLERQSALISGLTLQSWTSSQGAAAILYDWDSSQLEVRARSYALYYQMLLIPAEQSWRFGGVRTTQKNLSGEMLLHSSCDHLGILIVLSAGCV